MMPSILYGVFICFNTMCGWDTYQWSSVYLSILAALNARLSLEKNLSDIRDLEEYFLHVTQLRTILLKYGGYDRNRTCDPSIMSAVL